MNARRTYFWLVGSVAHDNKFFDDTKIKSINSKNNNNLTEDTRKRKLNL